MGSQKHIKNAFRKTVDDNLFIIIIRGFSSQTNINFKIFILVPKVFSFFFHLPLRFLSTQPISLIYHVLVNLKSTK